VKIICVLTVQNNTVLHTACLKYTTFSLKLKENLTFKCQVITNLRLYNITSGAMLSCGSGIWILGQKEFEVLMTVTMKVT
jgi:hypothetical protein